MADKRLMRAFNDFIANNELREFHREGGSLPGLITNPPLL
jgi:hypothetical protein